MHMQIWKNSLHFIDNENLPKNHCKSAEMKLFSDYVFTYIKCLSPKTKIYLYMNSCSCRSVFWAGNSMLQGKDLGFSWNIFLLCVQNLHTFRTSFGIVAKIPMVIIKTAKITMQDMQCLLQQKSFQWKASHLCGQVVYFSWILKALQDNECDTDSI